MILLNEFYLVDVLLLLAVVAGQDAVSHVEMGGHRLVVGNTFGIVALDDALNNIGRFDGLLFHYLVVADDVKDDLWSYDGKS